MLLVILYILFLCIFFLFVAPSKKETKEKFIDNKKKNLKNKKELSKEYHYGKGLMIPQTAFIPDTNVYDRMSYNIHRRIKESDAKNVHHLFNAITNDNYYLFNNLDNVQAVENIKNNKLPYVNAHYNIKMDKSHIFTTGLPYLGYYKRKDVIMKPLEKTKKMIKDKVFKKEKKELAKKELVKKLIKKELAKKK